MDDREESRVMDEEGESLSESSEETDQQEQTSQGATRSGQTTANSSCGRGGNQVVAYPQDVVLAATSLALALTKGRSQYEIETLINLFSLTTNNLQSILAQVLINKKVQDYLETPL